MEVFPFLEQEDSLVVLGTAVKTLGHATHPWAGSMRHRCLIVIRLANSRLTTGDDVPPDLDAALLLLYNLTKYTNVDQLSELTEVLEILKLRQGELTDPTKTHLTNAMLAINERIAAQLKVEEAPNVPYKIL
jgi:hypothetical protein